MPVKEQDGKYYVKDEEYDTEAQANAAYMAYLDKAFDVKTEAKTTDKKTKTAKSKAKPKKSTPKSKQDADDDTWDIQHFGHD